MKINIAVGYQLGQTWEHVESVEYSNHQFCGHYLLNFEPWPHGYGSWLNQKRVSWGKHIINIILSIQGKTVFQFEFHMCYHLEACDIIIGQMSLLNPEVHLGGIDSTETNTSFVRLLVRLSCRLSKSMATDIYEVSCCAIILLNHLFKKKTKSSELHSVGWNQTYLKNPKVMRIKIVQP